jgi:ribosomal protein L34
MGNQGERSAVGRKVLSSRRENPIFVKSQASPKPNSVYACVFILCLIIKNARGPSEKKEARRMGALSK